MSLGKYIERLRYMDYLIRSKSTGNASSFSQRLNISVSQLKQDINEMRELGAQIEFDRNLNSYKYKDGCKLLLKFLKENDSVQ